MIGPSRPRFRLLVLLAMVAGVAAFSGCTQSPEVKKQKAVARAEAFLKSGKANEAIIELRNALQVDKDYVPALHALGRAYMAKAWYGDAVRELSRAQKAAPDQLPIAIDLGRASVESGNFPEADKQADFVLSREWAGQIVTRLLMSFLRREPKARWTKSVKSFESGTPGFHSRRTTAESTLGRGRNAPGGTVNPQIGVA